MVNEAWSAEERADRAYLFALPEDYLMDRTCFGWLNVSLRRRIHLGDRRRISNMGGEIV